MDKKKSKLSNWLDINIEGMRSWDWQVLMLCFIVACIFWFLHSLNDLHTSNIKVPIHISFEKERVVALNPPPKFLNVNVTGDGWNLLSKTWQLSSDPVYYSLDDPLFSKYVTTRNLLPQINDRLRDIKVNYMLQDTVFFHYDTIVDTRVSLLVDSTNIRMKEGFKRVSDFSIDPEDIVLTGPRSLLERLGDTLYISLSVNELSEPFADMIKIRYPKNGFISSSHETAQVQFDVERFLERREQAFIKPQNFPNNSDYSYIVIPQEAFVRFTVRESQLESLKDSIWVTLDYNDLNKKDSTICPTFDLPEAYIYPEVEPSHFRIIIE